jgi:shikimate kinase
MTSQPVSRALILIGFMGAGKSSVGRALAANLGWRFIDLDERIEQREGRRVAEIFRKDGEAGFRRMEYEALAGLLDEPATVPEKVIALGGGAFAQEAVAELIGRARISTVFLDAGIDELWSRCKRQSEEERTERPLLGSPEGFRKLYELRRPSYSRASLIQQTGGKTVDEIAAELILALGINR